MPKTKGFRVLLNNNYLLERRTDEEEPKQYASAASQTEVEDPTVSTKNNEKQTIYNEQECIFCKKSSTTASCIRGIASDKTVLKEYAERLKDQTLVECLQKHRVVWYHPKCWLSYRDEARKTVVPSFPADVEADYTSDEEMPTVRGLHKVTYMAITNFIREEIFKKELSILLYDLNLQYKAILYALNDSNPVNLHKFVDYDLSKKLIEDFSDIVVEPVSRLVYKKGVKNPSDRIAPTNISWTYTQIKKVLATIKEKD